MKFYLFLDYFIKASLKYSELLKATRGKLQIFTAENNIQIVKNKKILLNLIAQFFKVKILV